MSNIIENNVLDQYKKDGIEYALFVNRRRMVPDRKDGLKTIHRRILDVMYNHERCINRTVKSASVVGSIMKINHPHGDVAIYDSIKPLTNWFQIKYPLIDNQGNFGNPQGDNASAQRYTEIKLSQFALDCVIAEMKDTKSVVDWIPTYDGQHLEPEFLPVAVPLLLINGAFGIGYGLRTEIPSHNLNEVIDATIKLMHNPDAQVVLIPDHCMPCEIFDTNWKAICNKGQGTYKIRGIIDIIEFNKHPALVIRSLPDRTFLDTTVSSINKMIQNKELVQIVDLIDHSYTDKKTNKDVLEYIIVLRKGSDANYVRDVIYKKTSIMQTCRINFEVLDGINPMRMSYKAYLQSFIEFRKITKFRMYANKLQEVQTKYHEMQTYIKVLQSGEIDNIINMVRNQKEINDNANIEYLVSKLGVTDLQAKFVLNTDIRKLSVGYLNKYIEESNRLQGIINEYMNKILDEDVIEREIEEELLHFKQKYGKPRTCKVINEKDVSDIPKGEFKIIVTNNNFLKKVPLTDPIGALKGDSVKTIINVENTENILLFDEQGKVFKLPVHRIPLSDRSSSGVDIRLIIKNLTSNIATVMYEPKLKEVSTKLKKHFIVTLTNEGNIKRLDIEDFLSVPPSGILYVKLDKTDFVKDICIVPDGHDIIVYSKSKALRFNISEVPHQKRNTKGSRAMTTDFVDGLSLIKSSTTHVVVVTKSGRVNKFDVAALPLSVRGKSGSKVIKLGKDDEIQSIFGVNDTDILRIITTNGSYDIPVTEIQNGSSISAGNKMTPGREIVIKSYIKKMV